MQKLPVLFLSFLAAQSGFQVFKYPTKPTWRPVFTDDEKAAIDAAETKKQREQLVAEFRAKHLAAAGGPMAVKL